MTRFERSALRLIAVPCFAVMFMSCHTGQTMNHDWAVAVTTDGGISGRGLGAVSLTSTDVATSPSADALNRAVAAAVPEKWAPSYVPADNPHGYADQILYKLTLTRDGRQYTSWWYDQSRPQLPADLGALFDAAWGARQRR